jgi:hypothetical protein
MSQVLLTQNTFARTKLVYVGVSTNMCLASLGWREDSKICLSFGVSLRACAEVSERKRNRPLHSKY